MESAARYIEGRLTRKVPTERASGWQATFLASLFSWHEPDSDLLWRFRANLDNEFIRTNSIHLLGDEISRKKQNTFRVLLLGDSSPVGLGLKNHELAFGALLERSLENSFPDSIAVEIINASVSGYTSEQLCRFLDTDGRRLDPDAIILYCGNNDASISGYRSDRDLFEDQRLVALRNLSAKLATYRLLRGCYASVSGGEESGGADLVRRVTEAQFAENIKSIASACLQKGVPLYICKPPVPRLWPAGLQFKIFTRLTDEQGQLLFPHVMRQLVGRELKYCISAERFDSLYGIGDKITREVFASAEVDNMTPRDAIADYSSRLLIDSCSVIDLNNLAVALWQDGQYEQADSLFRSAYRHYQEKYKDMSDPTIQAASSPILYNLGINLLSLENGPHATEIAEGGEAELFLDSALKADFFSLRIKPEYLNAIDRLNRADYVRVVDLPRLFAASGSEKLFIDHCHPTAEGHQLIASLLHEMITRDFLADKSVAAMDSR